MPRILILTFVCSLTIITLSFSQPPPGPEFQKFVTRVNAAPEGERTAIVDSFMTSTTFPPIEDSTVMFVYRGATTSVNVPGDANGWSGSASPMTKLSTTDLWYRPERFEYDARLDYKFAINGGSSWILDPRNPRRVAGGFGANSELAMPGFIQPWEIIVKPSIPHGRTEVRSIYSTFRGLSYSVRVYLPPGYDTSTDSFPSVYFQDGSDYVGLASAVTVLDNLIDSQKIRPVVGVFVTPTNRNEEYAGSTRTNYRLFFARELVPVIDSIYRTYRSPDMRVVLGDSYGGNISALISWYHPDVFGNCGLHSGAFQPNGYEAYNLILNGPPKPDSIRYVSVWGTYEGSLTSNMRTLKDSLINKGYNIRWQLRHEGHSWGLWRATIDFMLEYFFPFVTGVTEPTDAPAAFQLEQNYPNPFNPRTVIRYSLVVSGYVTLKVYDITGRQVAILVNGYMEAGRHDVPFDATGLASGSYFYSIRANGQSAVGKLLLVR